MNLAIPDISSYEDHESYRFTDEEISHIISKSFPELGFYWCCINPNEMDKDPQLGTGDAIDDLLDIYKDLKEGYELYVNGKTKSAIDHWQWSYRAHWAEHLVELQVALHDTIYND